MKVLYISGPYHDHADELHGTCRNILEASRISLEAWRAGWAVFCPHKNTAGFQYENLVSWDRWLQGDLTLMERCDAVLMIPGWIESRGAQIERDVAHKLEIPVFYYEVDGIPDPSQVKARWIR